MAWDTAESEVGAIDKLGAIGEDQGAEASPGMTPGGPGSMSMGPTTGTAPGETPAPARDLREGLQEFSGSGEELVSGRGEVARGKRPADPDHGLVSVLIACWNPASRSSRPTFSTSWSGTLRIAITP